MTARSGLKVTLRRMAASCVLLLGLLLSGCAGVPGSAGQKSADGSSFSISQIPGISLYYDNRDIEILAKGIDDGSVSMEEARAIEERPLPSSTGLSYDIGLLRRAMAAQYRQNLAGLKATKDLAVAHGTNSILVLEVWVSYADVLRQSGRTSEARREYASAEGYMVESSRQSGVPPYRSGLARTLLVSYVYFATQMSDRALGERLISSYAEPAFKDPSVAPMDRLLLRTYVDDFRLSMDLTLLVDDPLKSYARRTAAIRTYQAELTGMKVEDEKAVALKQAVVSRIAVFRFRAGIAAVDGGRPSLANEQLELIEQQKPLDIAKQTLVDELRIAIVSAGQDYELALKYRTETWSRLTPSIRSIEIVRTGYQLANARDLAALGRWKEADETLAQVRVGPSNPADNDLFFGLRVVVRAVLGRDDPQLGEFSALESKYRQGGKGLRDGTLYFAARTIVFQQRGARSGTTKDWVEAVKSGREMGWHLRRLQAAGGAGDALIPQQFLHMAKEAYAVSASSALGKSGVSVDDVLDALQLLQGSAVDKDIAASVSRMQSVAGVSPQALRAFQDQQRAAGAAQARLTAVVKAVDADPREVSRLTREANEASALLDQKLSELMRASPNAKTAFGVTQAISLREVQRTLSADEAILAAAPMSAATLVVIVTKGGVSQRLVPAGSKQVSALVERVRRSTAFDADVNVPAFDTRAARELYGLLLGWAEKDLRRTKSLAVAATGPLGAIPFGLLVRDDGKKVKDTDYKQISWLIRSMSIAHAPSLSSWYALSSADGAGAVDGFIAWANPDFTGQGAPAQTRTRGVRPAVRSVGATPALGVGTLPENLGQLLPQLPETQTEAASIARALGSTPGTDVLARGAATRASVLQRSASGDLAQRGVVMFATHGLVPSQVPGLDQPALAMAHDAGGPSALLLQLDDVLGLRLNADWVILSACNTASAGRAGGDPLSGLARGFFFAGARGMLVTHWEVESESAAAITTRTLERFAKNKRLGRADALQQTAIDLIDGKEAPADWSHPAFWAAYALVGDGGRGAGGQ